MNHPPTTMFIAGWNNPGYLPECDPIAFLSFDDAKAYIIEAMDRHADSLDSIEHHDAADALSSEMEDLNLTNESDFVSTPIENLVYWITSEPYDADRYYEVNDFADF